MDITSFPKILIVFFFQDGVAQVLNHSLVHIFAVQPDREGQPGGPGHNYIVSVEVREADEELLILVYRTRVIHDDHGLPHPFVTTGLAERSIGIKLTPEFVRSHGNKSVKPVLNRRDNLQMSCPHG